jgi:excisionase family DNA binding protein
MTKAANTELEWLTLPQVAKLYGVTRQRAGQLVREGKIEAVKSGTRWRVSRRWLDAQHELGGGAQRPSEDWLLREPSGGLSGVDEETLIRVVEAARPPGDGGDLRPGRRRAGGAAGGRDRRTPGQREDTAMTAKVRAGALPEQEFLTVPQVARLYGVSARRALAMIEEGKIEASRPPGHRRWRVSRRWLDAQHTRSGGVPLAGDPFLAAFAGVPDAPEEATIRRIVREELRAAVREELAHLAAGLAAVLHPPGDELLPRRRV